MPTFGDLSASLVQENSGERLALIISGYGRSVRHGQIDPTGVGANGGKLVRSDVASTDRFPELAYDANGKLEAV